MFNDSVSYKDSISTNPTTQTFSNCTFYYDAILCMQKIECKSLTVTYAKYAQYNNAIKVVFIPKGKRSPRGMWLTNSHHAMVLAGFGHVEPLAMYDKIERGSGVVSQMSRYSSYDKKIASDFDVLIDLYTLDTTKVTVLADFRKVNTYNA